METLNRDLNIPVKYEGDEVTDTEFNSMVTAIGESVRAVRCTQDEYDALTSHDRGTMYFVDDDEGELLFWYLGDVLLCRNASAASSGFAYAFPLVF